MIKVLQIREVTAGKANGIDVNCQGLIEMFSGDNDIEMLPTVDYRYHKDIFNRRILDRREISDSIKYFAPDIIHIHGATSFSMPLAVACGLQYHKKIVLSPHFHPFYALRSPIKGKIFFNLVTRRVLNKIDLIYTINNEDTSQFSKFHKNVVCIPHYVKCPMLQSGTVVKNPRMILIVGRLYESNKGLEHLFHLPEGKYEIHCVSRGPLNLRSDMIQHENISDYELTQLYKRASLLVVPSRYEAFSYVALEALMCNTPVVMSDRVRIADHLKSVDGYSIFKYHDYSSFVTSVENTIGRPVDVKKIASIFDESVIKQKYKSAYESIAH